MLEPAQQHQLVAARQLAAGAALAAVRGPRIESDFAIQKESAHAQ